MANIAGIAQQIPLVKRSYKKLLSYGEGAKSDDFRMTVEGYADVEFLVQTSQIPEMQREMIEDEHGPHGVFFSQFGRFKNAVQVPITFREVISGVMYKVLREWIMEKKYLQVRLSLMGESLPTAEQHTAWLFEDTALTIDGVDLSVEDNTIIKPAGTLYVNWISHFDPEDHSLGWE